jgi:hypothetical protein
MPSHVHLLLWQKSAAGGKRGRASYSSGFDGFRGRPRARSGIKRVASPFPKQEPAGEPIVAECPELTVRIGKRGYESPTGLLRPGDLVIVSGAFPGSDEGASPFTPKFNAIKEQALCRGYKVCPKQVSSPQELADAINDAVIANGGKPFRRILLISHAGGGLNGPSAKLSPVDRLAYNSNAGPRKSPTENLPSSVGRAINKALTPGGILVLATCGYYNGGDEKYKKAWLNNLKGWAQAVGHGVYASPGPAEPNLSMGADTYKYKERDPGSYVGFGPNGVALK